MENCHKQIDHRKLKKKDRIEETNSLINTKGYYTNLSLSHFCLCSDLSSKAIVTGSKNSKLSLNVREGNCGNRLHVYGLHGQIANVKPMANY